MWQSPPCLPSIKAKRAVTNAATKANTAVVVKHKRRYCKVEGCTRIVKSQGVCQGHGAQPRPCHVSGCTKQAQGGYAGMCKLHYAQTTTTVTKKKKKKGKDDSSSSSSNNKRHGELQIQPARKRQTKEPGIELEGMMNVAVPCSSSSSSLSGSDTTGTTTGTAAREIVSSCDVSSASSAASSSLSSSTTASSSSFTPSFLSFSPIKTTGKKAYQPHGTTQSPGPRLEPRVAPRPTTATTSRRRMCQVAGCIRVVKSRGVCQRHGATPQPCKIAGCPKQAQGNRNGMCKSHFNEQQQEQNTNTKKKKNAPTTTKIMTRPRKCQPVPWQPPQEQSWVNYRHVPSNASTSFMLPWDYYVPPSWMMCQPVMALDDTKDEDDGKSRRLQYNEAEEDDDDDDDGMPNTTTATSRKRTTINDVNDDDDNTNSGLATNLTQVLDSSFASPVPVVPNVAPSRPSPTAMRQASFFSQAELEDFEELDGLLFSHDNSWDVGTDVIVPPLQAAV